MNICIIHGNGASPMLGPLPWCPLYIYALIHRFFDSEKVVEKYGQCKTKWPMWLNLHRLSRICQSLWWSFEPTIQRRQRQLIKSHNPSILGHIIKTFISLHSQGKGDWRGQILWHVWLILWTPLMTENTYISLSHCLFTKLLMHGVRPGEFEFFEILRTGPTGSTHPLKK